MGLHPTLAAVRRNLPKVARSQGFDARVTSAYRSRAKQTWLYNRYLAGLQAYPVAPPGTSDHETGMALDVVSTDTNKLVALLTSAGLSWAGPDDPVHFSLKGPQIAAQSEKRKPLAAYAEDVGSMVPPVLTFIPGVSDIARVVQDPENVIREGLDALLTAILGPL